MYAGVPMYIQFTLGSISTTNNTALHQPIPAPTPGHPPQPVRELQPIIGCGA